MGGNTGKPVERLTSVARVGNYGESETVPSTNRATKMQVDCDADTILLHVEANRRGVSRGPTQAAFFEMSEVTRNEIVKRGFGRSG